jgi:ribosomal protein S18 acetylase RimI-like enzyme
MEWAKDSFIVSDDINKIDIDAVHKFLTNSYWAKGRTRELVAESIKSSFNIGLFQHEKQIGFARIITDFTTFGYLCDVYVLEEHRNQKLGHFLIEYLLSHPKLKTIVLLLKTTDAQSLYRDFNFKDLESPIGWMLRRPITCHF